jgi:hypothetical protein
MNIDDFALELRLLQNKDADTALGAGFKNKSDWFDYISKQDDDKIANDVINLALRYNLDVITTALKFDENMVRRVEIVLKRKVKEIKKAA